MGLRNLKMFGHNLGSKSTGGMQPDENQTVNSNYALNLLSCKSEILT